MIHADLVMIKESARLEEKFKFKLVSTGSFYKMCGRWHRYLSELGVHLLAQVQ